MRRSGWAGRLLPAWRRARAHPALAGAALSFGCTAVFTLYHGALFLGYGSAWHGSIGVFYLLLMAVRGTILLSEARSRARPAAERDRCRRRTFLISSALLLALDLALALPISMMVTLDKPVSMGLTPAIAMATYTTWKITMASIHMGRQRSAPGGNLLTAELRTVNFIDALVSILTLQNTLIMVKRTDPAENSMLPLSAASSAVIYAVIVVITLRMLRGGLREGLFHSGRRSPCSKSETCDIMGSNMDQSNVTGGEGQA